MNILTSLPQWKHCIGMKNYVEIKHCIEKNTQTDSLIDTNLSVDSRLLKIVKFDWK